MPLNMSTYRLPLRIEVDDIEDTVTIDGVRYSCEMFRRFGIAKLGTWLRINARDITMTVQEVSAGTDLAKQFDQLSGVVRGVEDGPVDARCDADIDRVMPKSGA